MIFNSRKKVYLQSPLKQKNMKSIISILSIVLTVSLAQAQQISLREISSNIKFNQQIDEFNNGKEKIKYADIQ